MTYKQSQTQQYYVWDDLTYEKYKKAFLLHQCHMHYSTVYTNEHITVSASTINTTFDTLFANLI